MTEPRPAAGSPDGTEPEHLFQVRDLTVDFRRSGHPPVRAVDGITYHLDAGETLVLLGESGSGKSVSSMAAMGLLDPPPAATVGGSVTLGGNELLTLDRDGWSKVRGPQIAMVFQDALSALNPCLSVGFQISETLRAHLPMSRKQAKAGAVDLMGRMRIPDAARRVGDFPHQFSGGMRQRIMIAMAIAAEPQILIADEPTTALDVTVQAQIMDLLAELREERRMGLLLITHDLGVAADVADRMAVMYHGRIVEEASVQHVYAGAAHPYTRGLLASVPRFDRGRSLARPIPGSPPGAGVAIPGCAFHPRCPRAQDICRTTEPQLLPMAQDPQWTSACHFSAAVAATATESGAVAASATESGAPEQAAS